MNISIIGVGYVGLTTGTCFAEVGNNVLCMDTDEEKVKKLKRGHIPIYEPGLEGLVKKNYAKGSLDFTTDLKKVIDFSEVIFVAVGTPTNLDNTPNLEYVYAAVNDIAMIMNTYKILVIKSTVPVGTGLEIKKKIKEILITRDKKNEFDMVSNPEFLRQGSAVEDFLNPDRIVIGTESDQAKKTMMELYDFHLKDNKPSVITNIEGAEMIKYVSNAFLATKISYINEIAILCEKYNVDVAVVAKGMGLDKRIGDKFLNPGPGYGGSCFPKDTKALMYIGNSVGYEPKIIKAVIEVNNDQIKHMTNKILRILKGVKGKTITILGVAFKGNTDDIRESPAIPIIQFLLKKGAKLKIYDPKAMGNCKEIIKKAEYCKDIYGASENSDCIIIMTEWEEFLGIDFGRLRQLVREPVLIDLRNMYQPEFIKESGFSYEGVGRK
jgi:UDPglucose 6-dehydrogenase